MESTGLGWQLVGGGRKCMTRSYSSLSTTAGHVTPRLFFAILLTVILPLVMTLALTSAMSPLHFHTYTSLGAAGFQERTQYFEIAFTLGIVVRMLAYLTDLERCPRVNRCAQALATCLLFVGFLGCTPRAPSIPILSGLILTAMFVATARRWFFQDISVDEFSMALGMASGVLALAILVVWGFWAFTPWLGGKNLWSTESQAFAERGFKPVTAAVIWSAPLIVAGACLLAAFFSVMRSQYHLPEDINEPLSTRQLAFLRGELKSAIMGFGLAVVCIWLAAALSARDMGLGDVILRIAFFEMLGIVFYLFSSIGPERIRAEVERTTLLEGTEEALSSDWITATLLLVFWPLVPIYFSMEAFHQRIRAYVGEPSPQADLPEYPEPAWLAREARGLWVALRDCDKRSVLSKASYVGLGIFGTQVLVSQGLPLFLSALNDRIADWPLVAIFAILWVVGVGLFLLPPVPGLPVYLLTGIVVTERCAANNISFTVACSLSIIFSTLLKASGAYIQMMCIGRSCSSSVAVKRFIQVHTPPMRAVRHILSKPGLLHIDKISVLCGGPDWPTFVIAGIMNLSPSQCLLGAFPVVFMVIPMVLTTAFTTRAGRIEDADTKDLYNYISYLMVLSSSLVLGGYMTLAGFFIDKCVEEHGADLDSDWCRDPQEGEVLALIEQEASQRSQSVADKRGWSCMPGWLQSIMFLSALLSSACTSILLLPIPAPFQEFRLTDSIASLPGGSWTGIINVTGEIGLCSFSLSLCGVLAFHAWCFLEDNEATNEDTPLLSKGS